MAGPISSCGQREMSASLDNHFRIAVENAGAEFVSVKDGCVYFRDPQTGEMLSLYCFACTAENLKLSLKDKREKVLDFPPLLPTEAP